MVLNYESPALTTELQALLGAAIMGRGWGNGKPEGVGCGRIFKDVEFLLDKYELALNHTILFQ